MPSIILSSSAFSRGIGRAKEAAQRGPVFITDRGKPTHVLLTMEAYRDLVEAQTSIADLLMMPGGADSGGKTIIEALEQNIYKESAFGIVWLTPDDYGYSKTETAADRKPRARQNVIPEMGMVMAALGRDHMAILQKSALERPSDTDGILRIEFNDHVREMVPKLVQRLQAVGFKISAEMVAAASA